MHQRRTPTPQEIDGIEKTASTRIHKRILCELKNDPSNFESFKSLKKVESDVYYLAKDYLDAVQRNLVPKNEEVYEIAKLFGNDTSTYDTINQLANSVALKNTRFLKTLIETVEDCIDSAYQLAVYRQKTRQEAYNQSIKEILARIECELVNARHERENRNNVPNDMPGTAIPISNLAQNISPPKITVEQIPHPSNIQPSFARINVNFQSQYSNFFVSNESNFQKSSPASTNRKRARTSFLPTTAKQQRRES